MSVNYDRGWTGITAVVSLTVLTDDLGCSDGRISQGALEVCKDGARGKTGTLRRWPVR
jgi:hypothetical protein